jgi:hypothetical protein
MPARATATTISRSRSRLPPARSCWNVRSSVASRPRGTWSASSGYIHASASPVTSQLATEGSASRAQARPATRWSRRPGMPSARPGRFVPWPSASRAGAAPTSPPCRWPESSPCWSGSCSPTSRTTPSRSHRWSARSSAAWSWCGATPHLAAEPAARRCLPPTTAACWKAARRPGRVRLPAAGVGLEGGQQAGCGCDTGARAFGRQCGSSAAGPEPQRPALEHVVTRTPPRLWHHQPAAVQPKLTFIRRSPPTRGACR